MNLILHARQPSRASRLELVNIEVFFSFIICDRQEKSHFSSQGASYKVILGYASKAHQSKITEIQCMSKITTESNWHNVQLLCCQE